MTRLSSDNITSINDRIPFLDESYRAATGMSPLEIGHFASETELLPLDIRRRIRVACVPITAGEGIIGDFCETVSVILREFADVDAFVTEAVDVAGLAEAEARRADLVYLADDNMCFCRNLRTGAMSDNGFATGRGFASLLYLSSSPLDTDVLILGSGKVGAGAYHFLARRDVPLKWYDLREASSYGMDPEALDPRWKEKAWDSIIDATTSPSFIEEAHIAQGGTIAAPGIPFGVQDAALGKARLVFHDELETGVMVMFCEGTREGYH